MAKTTNTGVSRRKLMRGAAAATALPVLVLSVGPAHAKASQSSVAYQATPKGGNSCANCGLFQPPSECKLVNGPVAAGGWCKIWVKKAG